MPEFRPDPDDDRTVIVARHASPDAGEGSRIVAARAWRPPPSEAAVVAESAPAVPGGPPRDETPAAGAAAAPAGGAAPQASVRVEMPASGIRRLVIAEGGRRNPLREDIIEGLTAALRDAAAADDVRVVIIAAEGPAFSAGHDLREMTARRADPDGGRAYFADVMARCSRMMRLVAEMPKPAIAEVQGIATAAGCQLVAACDLAVAASTACFGLTGINVGLFCSTPMVAVSRTIARKRAMEMLLTGETIDARQAAEWGLVNRVVEPEILAAATLALATKIASKSATAIRFGKPAFMRQAEMSLDAAYRFASEVMVENLLAADAKEGIAAFLEKREPRWMGK